MNRRQFLGNALVTGGALTSAVLVPEALTQATVQHPPTPASSTSSANLSEQNTPVDFRYSPVFRQTAFCFPDDHHKSLISESGELLYGYDRDKRIAYFPLKFGFALDGMQQAKVTEQRLESPTRPIVHTTLEWAHATMALTTFATDDPSEGRVDNVLMEIHPRHEQTVNVVPLVNIHSAQKCEMKTEEKNLIVSSEGTNDLLFVCKVFPDSREGGITRAAINKDTDFNPQVILHRCVAASSMPCKVFFRFPQAGQSKKKIVGGLNSPERQLEAARKFWSSWSPSRDPVAWDVPGSQGEFVVACARNILQAREEREGKLTFQVGPTCYRGLWVVDGNFILEAARYLGYDKEAIEGLRTTWTKQEPNGQIVAGGGREHYKDTAIAMFTLVRQCELSQDWSLLHELEPNVVAAIQFLDSLRGRARAEGSSLGKYGLLAKGFADGGIDGVREELTNTLWTIAGLKAIGAAGEQQQMPNVAHATQICQELYVALNRAASREMRSYDGDFQYLPMLLKDDPAWNLPDPWDRPRPQSAQWALSHTIFPGTVFSPEHPIVKGHVALMQAVRREGIPSSTGWLHHEGVWTYIAPFVAEFYLWVGMKQAAHDTFIGFLNHATPQYCWREEQPLQDALVGSYIGDMPHNWASAECIRYSRHMMALEDGAKLRLLAGITAGELAARKPYVLSATPTRFGRLDLKFEPLDRGQGWRLSFRRGNGPTPASVSLPTALTSKLHLSKPEGVSLREAGAVAMIDPSARHWALTWKS